VFASYALTLGLISKLYGSIGQELFLLQMTDIGETSETRASTSVSSSSMAQKVNPAKSEALIHASRTIPRLAEVLLDDVVNFFERDSTVGPDEALEQISVQTDKNLKTARRLLDKLQVNSAVMQENLGKTKGFIMAQRIAFALAPKIGKDEADELLHGIIKHALEAKQDFRTALLADVKAAKLLSPAEVDVLLDPRGYLGMAHEEVDAVIRHAEALRKGDPKTRAGSDEPLTGTSSINRD
jgi:adenylosuccinate lyase